MTLSEAVSFRNMLIEKHTFFDYAWHIATDNGRYYWLALDNDYGVCHYHDKRALFDVDYVAFRYEQQQEKYR